MTGIGFLASFLATGELCGLRVGSTLAEADRAFHHPFVDVVDEGGAWLRRDHGLVEFAFNPDSGPEPEQEPESESGPEPAWVMATATVRLHRLASDDDLARTWARSTGVAFPRYTSWEELYDELSRTWGVPELDVADQGGFLRYRAASSNVSVLVVDEEDEERGHRVGDGDVWSLDLWAPFRTVR
ncbi:MULTISPECIES: hypothetical protein [unclassified Streptomyces]|uniref:hypothetical protein n=1 Tax=unclassified Streptomyces TaxID=2593676 RepID=UPI0006AE3BBD|nr:MULTISPECIES: hypothetical protein [unclassified Streptomyces]KOX17842.1 hypothetical protein ADL06_31835 [Streptomyces sp. NRRL F-6491]KOX36570.1 hypothetical protein ADL08_32195 [Streptomyces sp. NRRL F-6492]